MSEFKGVAKQVMPAAIFDESGEVKMELLDDAWAEIDTDGDGVVGEAELERSTLAQLPADTSHKGTVASVAAKLGIDALDLDRNGLVSRSELEEAARAVAAIRG